MFLSPSVSGPDNDRTIFPTSLCGPKISGPENDQIVWLFSGPEISGPDNDQMVWSLSGPGRCLVLLHRDTASRPGESGKHRGWVFFPYPCRASLSLRGPGLFIPVSFIEHAALE